MSTGEQRILLLATIREFAQEQARIHGEEEILRQRHYDAYLQLFHTGDGHLRGADSATWLARLQPEQDNLRAALPWTINEARYADAVWLLIAAGWFWNLCGNRYEKGRWIAQRLPYRDQLEVDLRLQILGSLHSVAGAWAEIYTLWNAEPGSAEADQLDVLMLLVEDIEMTLNHGPISRYCVLR